MFGTERCQPTPDLSDQIGALGPFVASGGRLSDCDIRQALASGGDPLPFAARGVVLEEVECWRGYVRADYLCASDEGLSVVEIKSDRDSLRRFDEQVRVYSAIADRVVLIVGWSLAARAMRLAPRWWDVVLVEREATSDVRFVPLRDGSPNPGVAGAALVSMLPIAEVRHFARSVGIPTTGSRSRELRELVAGRVSLDALRVAVCDWLAGLSKQRVRIPVLSAESVD